MRGGELTTQPTRIHVVTVAYNPGPEIEAMVRSLPWTSPSFELTMTIVDNGDDPSRVDDLVSRYGMKLLRSGKNLGYGRGANSGFDGVDAPWFLLLNPDTVVHEGAIDELLKAAKRWPDAAALGPKLVGLDGEDYPSARELPSLRNGVGHAIFANVWPSNPWTRKYHGTTAIEHVCGWLSGAALLMRGERFHELGGFDPAYFMFFEDVDLGRRIRRSGYQSVFVPTATVTHEQGTTWKDRPESMIREHHASARRYLASAYPGPLYAPLRAAMGSALALRAVFVSRTSSI